MAFEDRSIEELEQMIESLDECIDKYRLEIERREGWKTLTPNSVRDGLELAIGYLSKMEDQRFSVRLATHAVKYVFNNRLLEQTQDARKLFNQLEENPESTNVYEFVNWYSEQYPEQTTNRSNARIVNV